MEAQSAKPMVVARTSPSNSDVEDGREDMSGSIRDGSGRDEKPTTTELTSKSKGKKDFKLMDYEVTNAVTSELQRRGAEGVANDGEPGQEELGPTSGLSIYNVDIRTGMNDLVGVAWYDGEPCFTFSSNVPGTSNDFEGPSIRYSVFENILRRTTITMLFSRARTG